MNLKMNKYLEILRAIARVGILLVSFLVLDNEAFAQTQDKGLVNTSQSPYARINSINMGDAAWTKGFWADRFKVCKNTMVPHMWDLLKNPELSHSFENFRIAADLDTGEYEGPVFHDGDFYKWLEAAASVYAITEDKNLKDLMDRIVKVIGKAQFDNGYMNTEAKIRIKNNGKDSSGILNGISFEMYNMGHLMTTACVYYRATGEKDLLNIAEKAADFLIKFYKSATPELAKGAICPSHFMGLAELWRTTRNKQYLKLFKKLFDLWGETDYGKFQNQDRIPFREQKKAVGHAVRANYLYAGAADLFMETGDSTLLTPLNLIWKDVVHRKMYITGACGALYDGVYPDGTSYHPEDIQQVHQAYGRDYQLPNFTAHNETCANIGNVLWNWRMFQMTGKARYMDVVELAMYNSVLSGINLEGTKYFYANPLAVSDQLPFTLRWSKDRVPYIPLSFCCPPNVVRTIAESIDYAYGVSEDGIWFNLYGGSQLNTTLKDGSKIKLSQKTNYPWDGKIKVDVEKAPKGRYAFFFRIPGWCSKARISVNGKSVKNALEPGTYVELNRNWKSGDKIQLDIQMKAKLMQANPLVEADQNKVAVQRGPLVYCMESTSYPEGIDIFNLAIPYDIKLDPFPVKIDNEKIVELHGKAKILPEQQWNNDLYQSVSSQPLQSADLRLIPYFAWDNKGKTDMTVWMTLIR